MAVDTLIKLLQARYQEYGEARVAMRRKDYGIWNEYTWKDYYENVKYFSLSLINLGLKPGEKVAIIGENDPEWFWAALAVQAARGITVGIFTDCLASEVKYVIEHSDSDFVVVDDQEQADKMLEIKNEVPNVKKVIYWDPKGMHAYTDPWFINFYDALELGKEYERNVPQLFQRNIEEIKPEDIAVICYTSGTSGVQKGALCSHQYLMSASECWCALDTWQPNDDYLTYLPPAWSTEWVFGISSGLRGGVTIYFAEKPETVQANVREIAPRVVFYNPRMWESLNSLVQAKVRDTLAIFRFSYRLFIPVGYRIADARLRRQELGLFWKCLHQLAEWLLFRPLRDKLGLVKIRWAYTAGAGISPDIIRFFQAIGVNLKQIYGLTEGQINTAHWDGDVDPATSGQPLPGQQVRISEISEILVKPPVLFSGYHKDTEGTKRSIDSQGWFLTGDAGYINEEGHLVVMDRVASLMELGQGRKFAPDFIETRLRFSQYIKDVMINGGKTRDFVSALIIISLDNVGKWAEARGLPYTTFSDLSQKPQVADLILDDLRRVNALLPEWAKIIKYILLHKEFDPDEAELTRTRKLRRRFMEEKYGDLLDAMYTDVKETVAEMPVTYQDGRRGLVKTTINIRNVD